MKKNVFGWGVVTAIAVSIMSITTVPVAAEEGGKTCLISTISQGTPFAQLVWSGFETAQENYGVDIKMIEALDNAEYEEQIRAMAEMGYNPIYTMFDALNAYVVDIAPEYPDIDFYMIDSALEPQSDNVCSLVVDPTESSFVAGFVAAKTTQTGKIGWIGSLEQANILRFRDGYTAGARYTDPDIEILTSFTGDNTDSVKGQEAAKILINDGVDVIFQSANLSGLGVITACAEAGIKAIGVDEWQGDIDDCVFWSSLKDIDSAVVQTIGEYLDGEFESGFRYFTLETGARAYDERDYEKLSPELKEELDELVEKVISGEIVVADLVADAAE
ncbi:MAG: BMP family ABC transporter substrate-binding protein [Lachnospiraceae bacterium]|nr:BMP family ABC transporter substrate-binding protein [Lachnospiraceae bacterium]